MPTTIWSRISCSLSMPNSQSAASEVINWSAVSVSPCEHWLNLALSNITFFRTLTKLSIFTMTSANFFRFSAVMFIEVSISLASSPRWQSSVLTCVHCLPKATLYCSKCFFHFAHSSGETNVNEAGVCSIVAGSIIIKPAIYF